MLEQVLTSGVLIAGIFLVRFLFGRHIQQRARYALWLLVLAKLLLPVLSFEAPYGVMDLVSAVTGYPGTNQAMPGQDGLETVNKDRPKNKAAVRAGLDTQALQQPDAAGPRVPGSGPKRVFVWIWIMGGCMAGASMAGSNIAFTRRLYRCRREVSHVACPLKVYEAGAVASPCLSGVFRPAIYLPPGFLRSGACMEHILAHEYAHYRHKDHVWALLRCLCIAAYWFHPLVWAAAFASIQDGELACDEAAIHSLGEKERQPYGHTLLKIAAAGGMGGPYLPCAVRACGKNTGIKERVTMIVKKPKARAVTGVVFLSAVVLLAGAAFSHTDAKKVDRASTAKDQAQKPDVQEGVQNWAWEYHVKANDGKYESYMLDVSGCQAKDGDYVLFGSSYADAVLLFTDGEKERIDHGEPVRISCDGAADPYILSRPAHMELEGSYLLEGGGASIGIDLTEGYYDGKNGWILSEPYSGLAWQPLLEERARVRADANTLVEVHNYYDYYDLFRNFFTADVPDKGPENGDGQQWLLWQYYGEYLTELEKLRDNGAWAGPLAKVRVVKYEDTIRLIDQYIP